MAAVPFAVQSYRHDSLPISAQRTLNLYAEKQVEGAKTKVSIHGDPGITTFATAGEGPIRGFHMLGGLLYAQSGGWLYSITNAATPVATQLGGQVSGTGVVSIADNGEELMIANGANGYIYDTTSGFRLITDTDFVAGNTTAYHSGRFIADQASTNQFAVSDSLDGSSWGALAFATKEAKSDNLLAVLNIKEVLHLLGVGSSELWAYTGAANVPFGRLPGGTLDKGVLAAYATAQEDEAMFMVGSDRMAHKVSGAQLQRVSQHAIETTWQGYTSVSDCFGLAYPWRGHKFVVFTFPSEEVGLGDTSSWALDLSTGLWHEKLSYDLNGTPLGRWRGNCAIEAYGKVLIGDSQSGKIGYLDGTVFTEFGDPTYARAVSPPYSAGEKRLFTSRFGLDIEAGVGLSSGQGSDPQVMLDISDDGGRTFGPLQPWASMGAQGANKTRVKWDRLGSTEPGGTRVFGITISDPVKRTILGAFADMKPGM